MTPYEKFAAEIEQEGGRTRWIRALAPADSTRAASLRQASGPALYTYFLHGHMLGGESAIANYSGLSPLTVTAAFIELVDLGAL